MPINTSFLRALLSVALLAITFALPQARTAAAGPVAEFESAVRSAYGDYRVALAQTNAKNVEASRKAIDAFGAKWAALRSTYGRAAPPQYADDSQFMSTLAKVADINQRAKAAVTAGKIAEAHDILEAIRDEIGNLRLRNGMIGYSDRMNAFHAHMEHMLGKRYEGFSVAGLGELREDTAVLAAMGEELKKYPPPEAKAPDYAPSLQDLLDAVATLQRAVRSGNGDGSKAALGKIKPAFGKLFVKFG